jgi:hypothetical protein
MVWLHCEGEGRAKARRFADLPPALHAAVRLLQTRDKSERGSITIRDKAGAILVTHDEIVRVGEIVRL